MLESVTALFAAGVVVIGTEDEEVDKPLDPNWKTNPSGLELTPEYEEEDKPLDPNWKTNPSGLELTPESTLWAAEHDSQSHTDDIEGVTISITADEVGEVQVEEKQSSTFWMDSAVGLNVMEASTS